jgi:sulfoacetaldehyde dehydrogenase
MEAGKQDITEVTKYVNELVARARKAQKTAEGFTQEKVDHLVTAIAWGIGGKDDVAADLARSAFVETQMGDIESKVAKVKSKARGLLNDLRHQKSVGIIEENKETGLTRIAKPIGVIASLVPSTQPEMHPMIQAMNAIKARDAVIFSPHPGGKLTTLKTVQYMREILKENGAPEDLLICAENPTIPMSNEIMRQCDVTFATGGTPMVRAAHSTGRPAYGVGAGNAVMVVDETADLDDAAAKIKTSKTFDLSAGCSCDNAVLIQESVYDDMVKAFEKIGAYVASPAEKEKLQKAIWPNFPTDHILNRKIVARPVKTIAETAGITVPDGTSFILVEETGYGADFPFSGEKMCLVIAIYKFGDIGQAIDLVNAIQAYSGSGHSCGIFSTKDENVKELALKTYTTRVNRNLPNAVSNTGNWFNKMPVTSSLGCGSWGGNIISENKQLKHYMNTTWLISGIDPVVPTDEELFGDFRG